MPYLHPRTFMPHAEPIHDAHIIPNQPHTNPAPGARMQGGTSYYQYKMVCSCQFEVLCHDLAEAERWQTAHLAMHGQQAVAVAATNTDEVDTSGKGAAESEVIVGK